MFWPNLRRLWLKTNPFTGEANWSHAVVVPIIGLYYLFVHREDLIRARSRQFIWGPPTRRSRAVFAGVMLLAGAGVYLISAHQTSLMFSMVKAVGVATAAMGAMVLLLDWSLAWTIFGLGVFVYGIYPGQNDYLKDLGMVITLFGIVLLLCGPDVMKIAWFPIVFLICAIPWPGLVYSWIAEPLQTMAAAVAVDVLKLSGVDSVCSGTKIIIFNSNLQPPRVLNVAEACAGMRSLMTFISVGGAIAFLSSRPLWQKLIIVLSAIPIAIFCNVMRISGQGLLDHYVSPQWSESFAHQFVGMMMLLPAFFMILGVGYLLDKLFIEEAEEGDPNYPVTPKSVAAVPTRETPIPTLGAMSPPATAVTGPIIRPVAPVPIVAAKPVASAPVIPAPNTKVFTGQPASALSSRSVTPVDPRPAAPSNIAPVRPVPSAPPMRMPPPPMGGVARKQDGRRLPPAQPNALKSRESK